MKFSRVIKIIRGNKVTRTLAYPLDLICHHVLARITAAHPYRYPAHNHKWVYGRRMDLENPISLHEKIYWMLYCTDTSIWTELTDKVKVRSYIERMGYGNILNKVYATYDCLPDMNTLFTNAPRSFVVKTNHCGGGEGVYLVKNKEAVNKKRIYSGLKKVMKDKYGVRTGQPHYVGIKPQIIVERYLINEEDPTKALPDYKFFCFNGEPRLINLVGNRSIEEHTYLDHYYTMSWERIVYKEDESQDFPRPKSFDEMVQIARKLSSPFPFVRLDFYEVGGKPIFGEMTFTPGFDTFCGTYGDKILKLGNWVDLSGTKKIRELNPKFY